MAESSGRYHQLPNEEVQEVGLQEAADAPPPYNDAAFPMPPSYNVATSLPSYDEAERSKTEASIPLVSGGSRERLDTLDDVARCAQEDDEFVSRDDFEDADQLRIGNDGIFMLTFFMSFLFNWMGFFLSFCLTTSAAGRYGAVSGFGLSLIKWILIVRFSTYFPGVLLFLRGFINYAKIRKMADSFSSLPRTRIMETGLSGRECSRQRRGGGWRKM
ncbi:hypothetical protein DNTS_015121 [Danionella cerebrum]|uniref:Nedd4 family interacting protein 1 n=1 Tax=Danionella cerebrum TaxID=2873325 RepID=A0A553P984_9TELE|nr:hypothetical protein DNTS_015121 [Danionella translucida]